MKIDKRNAVHWLYLCLFAINVLVAIVLRPFWRRATGRKRVIIYGHKFSGNLKPIHRYLQSNPQVCIDAAFLTMDPAYYRQLRSRGEPAVLAISPAAIPWLASATATIADHGLHSLWIMLRLSTMKFFDVWHGIPFKGFDPDDFKTQRRFDEAWVASPLLKGLYLERFGFRAGSVVDTGYARTDVLVRRRENLAEIRREFGLPIGGRVVLFAPTWGQDSSDRRIYPFGVPKAEFLDILAAVAKKHEAVVVVRTHLNSQETPDGAANGVVFAPFSANPETERLLLVTDVLVCDWSSIAFDFLLLDRPAIFLGVDPPFAKGLSLDESYRYGPVVSDAGELVSLLDRYLVDPRSYSASFGPISARVRQRVYSGCADGNATSRCVERLEHYISG